MRILGIDPGYATTGFGILQAERASVQLINYGTIKIGRASCRERVCLYV